MTSRKVRGNPKLAILVMGAIAVMAQSSLARADDDAPATPAATPEAPAAQAPAVEPPAPPVAEAPAAPAAQHLEKVEVTGSLIRRSIADEGSLPVTVIRAQDFERAGVTTVEQLINTYVGNQTAGSGAVTTANTVGAATGGQATASLKGLGPNYTLVLLNGQRMAGFAYAPGTTDINSIPLAAIERVEVLRDGASATYGSDAIGGVINFITKRSYQGFTAEADQGTPDENGGTARHFSLSGGLGNLDTDGLNVMVAYNLQRQQELSTLQRAFAANASADGISSNTYPANYKQKQANGTITYNPSAPGCVPPIFVPKGDGRDCLAASGLFFDLVPYSSADSIYTKASFKLPGENVADVEYVRSEHHVTTRTSPDPHGSLSMSSNSPYWPGNGVTPALPASVGVLDPTQTIGLSFRTVPAGKRTDDVLSTEDRLSAGLKGSVESFDYEATAFTTHNRASQESISGYISNPALQDLINGTNTQGLNPSDVFINPFGPNSATQLAALNAASITGQELSAIMGSYGINGHVSHEFMELDGGPLAVSLGAEWRKETFAYNVNDSVAALTYGSTGIAPGSTVPEKSRNVTAIYLEGLVPFTKELEGDVAVRTDHYDGFGASTNPKFSLRYQPTKELLFRGSAATGFRAPDLYQLYQAQAVTNTASTYNDPVLCPNGNPVNASVDPTVSCGVQQNLLEGGNPNLKAEKSRQFTFGVVLAPVKDLTVSIDAWSVVIKDQVRSPGEGALFNNSGKFGASSYVTCANAGNFAQYSTACGPQEPGNTLAYAVDLNSNIGKINARGVDFALNYHLLSEVGDFNFAYDLAYINKYTYELYAGAPDVSNLGVYSSDLNQEIFQYQHTASVAWKRGDWTADLINHFRSGYTDSNPNGEGHHVPQFWSWDVGGSYAGLVHGLTLTLMVRNLFDAPPPYSNQTATFQKGYDPYSGDPIGRVYFFGARYEFK